MGEDNPVNKLVLKEDVSNLPVLLTLHVRTKNIEKQLAVLRDSKIRNVYISVDGPRNEQDKIKQLDLFKLLNDASTNFSAFHIRQSKENHGVAVGMISALDWFFAQNTHGVVFEDDILFNRNTLVFLNTTIDLVEKHSSILLTTAFQPFVDYSRDNCLLQCNYPLIWGWGTSSYKWLQMRSFIFEKHVWDNGISRKVKHFWETGTKRVLKGYIDTWDIPIAAGMRSQSKTCIMPPVNLATNIGYDSESTHTTNERFPLGIPMVEDEEIQLWDINDSYRCEALRELMNFRLEKEVFQVKNRNLLTPLIAFFDVWRFRRSPRKQLEYRLRKLSLK